jgi:tRNA nucleotidyltransferase/poly(A) polymerase
VSHNRGVTARELANSICDALLRNGHQALLVGGCVRDLLLEREPADYDVTTDATPERVMELFPESIAVGAQFGVVLVPRDGLKVEVATFRSDVGYSDGRHPDRVVYAKAPQEDVQRRDFTINGLLMRHDTGEILDFVDGQADLKAGVIRAIGEPDRRFAEDKLRMLRAVRFAARFEFEIEHKTFAAIQRTDSRGTDETADGGRGADGIRIAGEIVAAVDCAAGDCGDEGRATAAAVSSRGRRVDSHADDDRGAGCGKFADAGVGRAVARRR